MNYQEFLTKIGSDIFSFEAEEIYNTAYKNGELLAPLKLSRVEQLFGELSNEIFNAAEQITKNIIWLQYANFLRLCYFALNSSSIPLLTPEKGNIPRNFAPIFALISHVDEAVRLMEERGIDKEYQEKVNHAYKSALLSHKSNFGYYAISTVLFWWSKHYLHPDIFPLGSLQFEITKMYKGEAVFKNKTSESFVALFEMEETEDAYIGKELSRGGELKSERTLLKSDFSPLVLPDDDILSVHIPAKAKLDAKSCEDAFELAKKFFSKYYPERNIKTFYCRSWLMDPELADILKSDSKIVAFQNNFTRYPFKSTGKEVFSFVHPQPFEKYEDLPENTALFRGLKMRYLNNKPICVYAGIYTI